MTAAVCIDDRGGMLFNRRRVSRDAVQQEDLVRWCEGRTLWVAPYSASLFDRWPVSIDEEFLHKAGAEDVCFVEDRPLGPVLDRIDRVVLYRWNRAYPADLHLDIDIAADFMLKEQTEFAGKSHERITREIYERR